jgi:tRNA pseudouridine38/39 synthase
MDNDKDSLENLSKEELIQIIQTLRAKRKREENSKNESKIPDKEDMDVVQDNKKSKKDEKKRKEFDMSKYSQRHIALKIAYLGWKYKGFASQADIDETVESQIFQALLKTKLITSRESANYSRCGRTDKGVNAMSQVIALHLRSTVREGVGMVSSPSEETEVLKKAKGQEISYARALNNVLPDDIKVLAWAPVPLDYSARFSCLYRTYKYFFMKSDLDTDLMRDAAQRFIGEHDFRNFCKIDVAVTNFKRGIISFDIAPVQEMKSSDPSFQMYAMTICGKAFLWHQVRCMSAVLFLIGQHLEQPTIIDQLLDIEKNPKKPVYDLASEIPLVLWDCAFEGIQWNYDVENNQRLYQHLQTMWNDYTIRSDVVRLTLTHLESTLFKPSKDSTELIPWRNLPSFKQKDPKYVQLMRRPKQESVEEKQLKEAKKKGKLEENDNE